MALPGQDAAFSLLSRVLGFKWFSAVGLRLEDLELLGSGFVALCNPGFE